MAKAVVIPQGRQRGRSRHGFSAAAGGNSKPRSQSREGTPRERDAAIFGVLAGRTMHDMARAASQTCGTGRRIQQFRRARCQPEHIATNPIGPRPHREHRRPSRARPALPRRDQLTRRQALTSKSRVPTRTCLSAIGDTFVSLATLLFRGRPRRIVRTGCAPGRALQSQTSDRFFSSTTSRSAIPPRYARDARTLQRLSWTVSTEPVLPTTAFRPRFRGPTNGRPARKSQGRASSGVA
jgi:hypothetical protein